MDHIPNLLYCQNLGEKSRQGIVSLLTLGIRLRDFKSRDHFMHRSAGVPGFEGSEWQNFRYG